MDKGQYKPRGQIKDFLLCKDREVLLEGPAGTGKSRGVLEKLYIIASKYPGVRILVARKTYKSITQSVRVTWEQHVLEGGISLKLHTLKQQYEFPNGSVIVLAGLNEPERTKSSEWDIIYVNEATELSEVEYETLLRGLRNNKMPYQQAICDCNPDAPTHWLNLRASRGAMTRFVTKHEDNPVLFDDNGSLTEFGTQYMAILESLTGVRYDRLRLGKWVAAEGMVYEEWDQESMLVDKFRIPKHWKRWLSIDFGVNNPFVCQWWTHDPDKDILYLYREIYMTGRLVEDHAHQIHEKSSGEHFQAIICDHDLEGRMTLERHITHTEPDCPGDKVTLWSTTKANKDYDNAIQLVKMRMKRGGLKIFRDSLVEFDQDLRKFGKPTSTVDELPGYVWDVVQSQRIGERQLDRPMKKNDHGMDAMRYFVNHFDDPTKAALNVLFSAPHKMTVEGQKQTGSGDKWLPFFGVTR